MNAETLTERGEREIVELHAFFQNWYQGKLDREDGSRFEQVLAENFVMILPDARILDRDTIVEAVREQYDTDSGIKIEISDVRLHMVQENTSIFTYEEWQGREGAPMQGRLSTVVFTTDQNTPNGLLWLHVHETWLPDNGGD